MNEIDKLAFAEAHKHIPTSEVLKDIADTEREIAALEAARPAVGVLADKILGFRIEAGIRQRSEFLERVRVILEVRQAEATKC